MPNLIPVLVSQRTGRAASGVWTEMLRGKARAAANACERQFVVVPINEDLLTFDLK